MEAVYVYLMMLMMCLTCSIIIYTKINSTMGSAREIKMLKEIVLMFTCAMSSDLIRTMSYANLFHMPLKLSLYFTLIHTGLLGSISYLWFLFVEMRLGKETYWSSIRKQVGILPLVILFVLIVFTPFYGFIIQLEPDGTISQGMFYSYFTYMVSGYYLYALLQFLDYNKRANDSEDVIVLRKLLIYSFPVIICLLIERCTGLMILVCPSIFVAVLTTFLELQETNIYCDYLTGLYNRRQWNNFKERHQELLNYENPIIVYSLDVDNFKSINDTYGHYAGDQVLKAVGVALNRVSVHYRVFASRLGGDEFVVAGYLRSVKDPDAFMSYIQTMVNQEVSILNPEWNVRISIGYASCSNPNISFEESYTIADTMMYVNKQNSANS